MKEDICKLCEYYNKRTGYCESDLDDRVPIQNVCQCGEADKIVDNLHTFENLDPK